MDTINWDRFIEGKITGVISRRDGTSVEVLLTDGSHKNYILTAEGVERCLIVEMRQQNIIDRISIWDASCDPIEYIERLRIMLYGSSEDDVRYVEAVNKALQSIRQKKTIFLEIEPVYGALVLVQASRVALKEAVHASVV